MPNQSNSNEQEPTFDERMKQEFNRLQNEVSGADQNFPPDEKMASEHNRYVQDIIAELWGEKQQTLRELEGDAGGAKQDIGSHFDEEIKKAAEEAGLNPEKIIQKLEGKGKFEKEKDLFDKAKKGDWYVIKGNHDEYDGKTFRFKVALLDKDTHGNNLVVFRDEDKNNAIVDTNGHLVHEFDMDKKDFLKMVESKWEHPAYTVDEWENLNEHRKLVRALEKAGYGTELPLLDEAYENGGLRLESPRGKYIITSIDVDKNKIRIFDNKRVKSEASFELKLTDILDFLGPINVSDRQERRERTEEARKFADNEPVWLELNGERKKGNIAGFKRGKYIVEYEVLKRDGSIGHRPEKEVDEERISRRAAE